jgi:glutamate racemase
MTFQRLIKKKVLGVIRPTTEVIGGFSESRHVGILGTTGTINSIHMLEIQKLS